MHGQVAEQTHLLPYLVALRGFFLFFFRLLVVFYRQIINIIALLDLDRPFVGAGVRLWDDITLVAFLLLFLNPRLLFSGVILSLLLAADL